MAKKYGSYAVACLGCMSLLMCGRDIRGKVLVRCWQKVLKNGDLFPLEDMIDKKVKSLKTCAVREGMGKLLPAGITWSMYLAQLRRNFCEADNEKK